MQSRENSFERTLNEFKKSLTIEQQRDFGATTLKELQITIAALQKRQASNRRAQNLRRIQSFLEGMEGNAKVIEVFLNVHSFVAFIWVGLTSSSWFRILLMYYLSRALSNSFYRYECRSLQSRVNC